MRLRIRTTTSKASVNEVYDAITKVMDGFDMPRGDSWDKGESYSKLRKKNSAMNFAILMAVTFVFLLMGVLFESVILPFSVILSIPFAFFGVYWTLWLTDTKMDDMASMGSVVLIGVVVNNAIVLVDMINRLRQTGMERGRAITEAGRNRYRPILMTTFTTVFGLLPMAVSPANMMGMPYAPLGLTMMGGLISSTFLTLLVVPMFYTMLDDLRTALGRIAAAAFAGSARKMEVELMPGDD
jgi:HAE1 family hydrophobic/amphiphilic exporter-1